MSTTIRVSDDTKTLLAILKDDDESWDEFLNRLARRERDVDELGGFADDGVVDDMETAREHARNDWDRRIDS
jgi:predicted CopG family antitoxin